jgi:glycerophosphoryl diester phosphodiesterase
MPTRLPSLRRPPIGFAHRGARANAPENTLEAFVLAVRLGATGLESDVWLTRDGEAVLDHDGVVRRHLRSRPIAQCTRDELPAHVPTLADLYDAVGTTLEISLDLKDAAAFDRVLAVGQAAGPGALEHLWICHPQLDQLTQWRPVSPEVHLVHSTFLSRLPTGAESHAALMAERGIDAVNLHHAEWTGGRTSLFHRFGVLCFGWDAQHRRILGNLLDAGIDAVYSDHVNRMVDALAQGA